MSKIKSEYEKIVDKAGFVVFNGEVDWASDYNRELNCFADLLVKDVLSYIDKAKCPEVDKQACLELKEKLNKLVREKYKLT